MANIAPFPALHYNPAQVTNLSEVITPPYDVISAEKKAEFLARHPYNFAHIDLPRTENDDYAAQTALFKKWQELKILVQDPSPSYTLYEQTFTFDGQTHQRRTLMGAVELCDFSENVVLPHENTHGKYKADRLQILRATQCQFSQIFGMVKDQEGFLASLYEEVAYHQPLFHAKDDEGNSHSVWKITGKAMDQVTAFFQTRPIYIVDGHHRYESALAYAREVGAYKNPAHPASRMLFAIANVFDPALVVLPTHRRLKNVTTLPFAWEKLQETFDLTKISQEELMAFCRTRQDLPRFALSLRDEIYIASPRKQTAAAGVVPSVARLSVFWSDQVLLKELFGIGENERSTRIEYVKDAKQMWASRTLGDVLVFHAPPSVESVTDVADERGYMPQKSTFFYPKLYAGLVLRNIHS